MRGSVLERHKNYGVVFSRKVHTRLAQTCRWETILKRKPFRKIHTKKEKKLQSRKQMEDDGNPKICDDKMMAAWYSASEGGEATGWRE